MIKLVRSRCRLHRLSQSIPYIDTPAWTGSFDTTTRLVIRVGAIAMAVTVDERLCVALTAYDGKHWYNADFDAVFALDLLTESAIRPLLRRNRCHQVERYYENEGTLYAVTAPFNVPGEVLVIGGGTPIEARCFVPSKLTPFVPDVRAYRDDRERWYVVDQGSGEAFRGLPPAMTSDIALPDLLAIARSNVRYDGSYRFAFSGGEEVVRANDAKLWFQLGNVIVLVKRDTVIAWNGYALYEVRYTYLDEAFERLTQTEQWSRSEHVHFFDDDGRHYAFPYRADGYYDWNDMIDWAKTMIEPWPTMLYTKDGMRFIGYNVIVERPNNDVIVTITESKF